MLVNGSPTDDSFFFSRVPRFCFFLAAKGLFSLMNAFVRSELFCGCGVGSSDDCRVCHLQFIDLTLIIGSNSWANSKLFNLFLCFLS